nr:MFS transporter [Pseudomonas insulae]
MARGWWLHLLLALAPLLVLDLLFGAARSHGPVAMPLFIAGLLAMFPSLLWFRRYKLALVATERALDSAEEESAWQQLQASRRTAMLGAALPAWVAALAVFAGLETIPQLLLALSSLVLLILYRIPRQLG